MIAAFLLAMATGPCDTSQTQSDLDICWAAQAKQADTALNARYQAVLASMHAQGISPKAPTAAQLAWISARDKTCDFEYSMNEGGSIAPMLYSECVDRMTRDRTVRLEDLLATIKANGTPALAPVSKAADAELNRVYKRLSKQQLTPAQRDKLVAAGLAWIAYRDKACAVERGNCLTDLTTERTKELENGWMGEQYW